MKLTNLSRQIPNILGAGLLLGAIVIAGCGGGGGGSSTTDGTTSTTGSTTATTGSTTATTGSTTATTTTGSTTATTGSTTATTGSTTATTGSTTATTGSTGSTTTTGSTTSTTGSTTSTTGSTTSTTSGMSSTISSLNFASGIPADDTVDLVINTKTNQPTLTGQPSKQVNTIFSRHQLASLSNFHTTFTFTFDASPANGDGVTFCVQGYSSTAVGGSGGELGYGNIPNSIAVKFDTHQNTGDPSGNCTGLYVGGADPYGGVDLTGSGIDLHSGHKFQVDISYGHNRLTSTITDTQTQAFNTQVYSVNVPQAIGGNSAYVGFTSAQDVGTDPQKIQTWVISSP